MAAGTEKLSKEDLRKVLTPEQWHVTQEKGTERPFTSPLNSVKEKAHSCTFQLAGEFNCVVCGEKLFVTDDKFDSGCGWPSFAAPVEDHAVSEHHDGTLGMKRTEVTCSKCAAHLGHVSLYRAAPANRLPPGWRPALQVFDDGGHKSRTGLRYCINGASLKFKPAPK